MKAFCVWLYPNNENPLDEGEAKAADGTVASCDGVGQTEGQTEANPVEEEGHCRSTDTGNPRRKALILTFLPDFSS